MRRIVVERDRESADLDRIYTCTCDECGAYRAGVLFYSKKKLVLFLCCKCEPEHFEKHTRSTVAEVLSYIFSLDKVA